MARPTLLGFVDDEMLRAPLTFDQVIDAVNELWRQVLAVHERQGSDAARMLQLHRDEVVTVAMRSLRVLVQAAVGGAGLSPPAAQSTTRAGRLELSLIDENDVAVDIEISRCVETIKSHAEFELRELQSLTSSLVGDVNVARDTNPFRPESFVRAFWDGVQTLPAARGLQAAFLRDAALPLARALRQGYAAACARLEEQGVEPATYRTIVVNRTTGAGHAVPPPATHDLNLLRASLPMPLDELTAAQKFITTTTSLPGRSSVDPRLLDLLSRLFDAIQSDHALPADAQALLLRLQPTALRVAMRDPSLLDTYDHAVWRFMDSLVFMLERSAGAELGRSIGFARNLVDHLVAGGTDDGSRFVWALDRLVAFERHGLAQSIAAAAPLVARLQAAEAMQAPPVTALGEPLDLAALDTVPAALISAQAPGPAAAAQSVGGVEPGAALEIYLQGEWRVLQLLWCDSSSDLWLLRQPSADRYWALRPRAVERLMAEHLGWVMQPRSLVRHAAESVLQSLETRSG